MNWAEAPLPDWPRKTPDQSTVPDQTRLAEVPVHDRTVVIDDLSALAVGDCVGLCQKSMFQTHMTQTL
jgi:hypothetical protein